MERGRVHGTTVTVLLIMGSGGQEHRQQLSLGEGIDSREEPERYRTETKKKIDHGVEKQLPLPCCES